MQKIIVVDHNQCLSCRSCQLACSLAHAPVRTLVELVYLEKPVWPRLILEKAAGGLIPLQCRHCADAPCLAVCPTGALTRETAAGTDTAGLQPVLFKQEACIGCRACLLVCPFGLIKVAPDNKTMLKCDLCAGQAGSGKQAAGSFVPACVRACPTRALRYLPLNEPDEEKRRQYALPYAVAFQADYERLRPGQEKE